MGKIIKYKMQLEVLTPVHIAGADYKSKLDKKEYLFNSKTNDLTIIDNAKFIDFLTKKNLLDDFINKISSENFNMLNFLKNNNIFKDLKKFTKVEYKELNIELKDKKESLNNIKLLNRDIENKVYISGSSIKGALVNALLVNYIIKNNEEFQDEKEEIFNIIKKKEKKISSEDIKKIKGIIEKIENKILYVIREKNGKKTKYFGLSVSDSYKINNNIKTNFYQDKDEKLEKSNKETSLPIIREYIEPTNKFKFDITLDFDILSKSKLNIKNYADLITAIENATDYLLENTLNLNTGNQNLILGANTGFHQKTIVHALFDNKKERLEVIKKILHKGSKNAIGNHLNDKFSPRVINRIKINNKLELAGLVEIKRIEEKIVGGNTNVGSN